MSLSRQSGITLLELMIVVAIIAILATIAITAFTRSTNKAKAGEVPAMFAEFKLREQGYYTENGAYLSTGINETTPHPATPARTPTSIAPLPDEWKQLRIQSDKQALYCTYVAIAGDAGDGASLGAKATSFGMTAAPAIDWFYLLAECDFDGKAANSFYFTSSEVDTILKENEGR